MIRMPEIDRHAAQKPPEAMFRINSAKPDPLPGGAGEDADIDGMVQAALGLRSLAVDFLKGESDR